MDIFGSMFRRREPVDENAEIARKQIEAMARRCIGDDAGKYLISREQFRRITEDAERARR